MKKLLSISAIMAILPTILAVVPASAHGLEVEHAPEVQNQTLNVRQEDRQQNGTAQVQLNHRQNRGQVRRHSHLTRGIEVRGEAETRII